MEPVKDSRYCPGGGVTGAVPMFWTMFRFSALIFRRWNPRTTVFVKIDACVFLSEKRSGGESLQMQRTGLYPVAAMDVEPS